MGRGNGIRSMSTNSATDRAQSTPCQATIPGGFPGPRRTAASVDVESSPGTDRAVERSPHELGGLLRRPHRRTARGCARPRRRSARRSRCAPARTGVAAGPGQMFGDVQDRRAGWSNGDPASEAVPPAPTGVGCSLAGGGDVDRRARRAAAVHQRTQLTASASRISAGWPGGDHRRAGEQAATQPPPTLQRRHAPTSAGLAGPVDRFGAYPHHIPALGHVLFVRRAEQPDYGVVRVLQ